MRHLPISSQLEYRRLINRMKMLEKQKEQKSQTIKTLQNQSEKSSETVSTEQSIYPNFTVTLQNQNRIIQDNDSIQIENSTTEMIELKSSKPSDSLKKQVLLKNTINSAKATSISSKSTDSVANVTEDIPTIDKSSDDNAETLGAAENKYMIFG